MTVNNRRSSSKLTVINETQYRDSEESRNAGRDKAEA